MILSGAAPQSVHESWVVPPGLEAFFLLSPALKRWAKLVRPYGAGSSYISFSISFHWVAQERVLAHIRQRCDDTLVFSDDFCCCGRTAAQKIPLP
jgi:hypothetical protein